MIIPILEKRNELKKIYNKVFDSYDPFAPAVSTMFSVKAVLFPTDSYHLTLEQFGALIHALSIQRENEFYISEIEYSLDPFIKGEHWFCSQLRFEEYTNLPIGVENAVYSTNGNWGIVLSHELHALLVCHKPFWDAFRKKYTNWKNDKIEFLNYWDGIKSEGVNINWLPDFLDNIID